MPPLLRVLADRGKRRRDHIDEQILQDQDADQIEFSNMKKVLRRSVEFTTLLLPLRWQSSATRKATWSFQNTQTGRIKLNARQNSQS